MLDQERGVVIANLIFQPIKPACGPPFFRGPKGRQLLCDHRRGPAHPSRATAHRRLERVTARRDNRNERLAYDLTKIRASWARPKKAGLI
jgi:hypothetical protein